MEEYWLRMLHRGDGRDFLHKRQVSLKELRESLYWLKLVEKASLIKSSDKTMRFLLQENEELLAKSIYNSKEVRHLTSNI